MRNALILLVLCQYLLAQSGNSAITGIVKDATSAPIPDAKLKVTNLETGVAADALTNTSGLYRVASLLPGKYRVEVDAAGFDHLIRGPVTLEVSQTVELDLTVEIGKHSESVTVSELAPMTESQSSAVSQIVNRQLLAGLPLPNRAASSLAALSPGVVMIDTGAGNSRKLPSVFRRRRPGAKSELHSGRG